MIKELQGNLMHKIRWNKTFLLNLLVEVQANEERLGNLLQNYERRFEKLPEDQKLSKLCSEASLNLVEVGQIFYTLPSPNGANNQSLCREYTLPRDEKGKLCKRVDRKRCAIRPCLGHTSLQNTWKIQRLS